MSFLFLILFYYIIDVLQYKKAGHSFFYVIGMNSSLSTSLTGLLIFAQSAHLIFSGIYEPLPQRFHPAFDALAD